MGTGLQQMPRVHLHFSSFQHCGPRVVHSKPELPATALLHHSQLKHASSQRVDRRPHNTQTTKAALIMTSAQTTFSTGPGYLSHQLQQQVGGVGSRSSL